MRLRGQGELLGGLPGGGGLGLCLGPGLGATSHRACQDYPFPCCGASAPFPGGDARGGRGGLEAAGPGCSGAQPDRSLSQWAVSQASAPGHLRGIKTQRERPPARLPCSRARALVIEGGSAMLHTLLIGSTLALLGAAPGQAQVPIQADFDASQVCPVGPRPAFLLERPARPCPYPLIWAWLQPGGGGRTPMCICPSDSGRAGVWAVPTTLLRPHAACLAAVPALAGLRRGGAASSCPCRPCSSRAPGTWWGSCRTTRPSWTPGTT